MPPSISLSNVLSSPALLFATLRITGLVIGLAAGAHVLVAQRASSDPCPCPEQGSAVRTPDLRSHEGVLRVELTEETDGTARDCHLIPGGGQSPTLQLKADELLILTLKSEWTRFSETPLGQVLRTITPDLRRPIAVKAARCRWSPPTFTFMA